MTKPTVLIDNPKAKAFLAASQALDSFPVQKLGYGTPERREQDAKQATLRNAIVKARVAYARSITVEAITLVLLDIFDSHATDTKMIDFSHLTGYFADYLITRDWGVVESCKSKIRAALTALEDTGTIQAFRAGVAPGGRPYGAQMKQFVYQTTEWVRLAQEQAESAAHHAQVLHNRQKELLEELNAMNIEGEPAGRDRISLSFGDLTKIMMALDGGDGDGR